MMKPNCPYCEANSNSSENQSLVVRAGRFKRSSDCRSIQRFKCKKCSKHFSRATFHPCFKQLKRHFNHRLSKLICSGVSQRRAAKILGVNRKTVVRKLIFLGFRAIEELDKINRATPLVEVIEFDELETFEHTKYKPLSVFLAVESKTRRILGFEIARMPAKGLLSKKALQKYGFRKDERREAHERLFKKLQVIAHPQALFKSDQNPSYPATVNKYFPMALHEAHKGQRGSIVGQGELKKVRFDPLFSLNHTCAMLRANINRLFRKTWCTTKIPSRLYLHVAIYAAYHNLVLIDDS